MSTRVIPQELSSLFVCVWHGLSLSRSSLMRLIWLFSKAQATDFLLPSTEITAKGIIDSFSPCIPEPSPQTIWLVPYHHTRDGNKWLTRASIYADFFHTRCCRVCTTDSIISTLGWDVCWHLQICWPSYLQHHSGASERASNSLNSDSGTARLDHSLLLLKPQREKTAIPPSRILEPTMFCSSSTVGPGLWADSAETGWQCPVFQKGMAFREWEWQVFGQGAKRSQWGQRIEGILARWGNGARREERIQRAGTFQKKLDLRQQENRKQCFKLWLFCAYIHN